MPEPDIPTRGPARPGPYIAAGTIVGIGIVFPLLVPIYAREEPRLWGMPFFYWYQMLWVLINAALLWAAFLIVSREDRRRRAAVRPGTDGSAAKHREA